MSYTCIKAPTHCSLPSPTNGASASGLCALELLKQAGTASDFLAPPYSERQMQDHRQHPWWPRHSSPATYSSVTRPVSLQESLDQEALVLVTEELQGSVPFTQLASCDWAASNKELLNSSSSWASDCHMACKASASSF